MKVKCRNYYGDLIGLDADWTAYNIKIRASDGALIEIEHVKSDEIEIEMDKEENTASAIKISELLTENGKWIFKRTSFTQAHYECSVCGFIDQERHNFCAGCGLKMEFERTTGGGCQ